MPAKLHEILKKVRILNKSNHYRWVGYLRADEIKVLLKAGAKEANNLYAPHVADRIKAGNCNPVWFYFFPSKKIKEAMDPKWFVYDVEK